MTNLPITNSNPPPAKVPAELTPPGETTPGSPAGQASNTRTRSGSSAVPANAAGTTQTNGMAGIQPMESFGALLAQQMDEARTPVVITPSSAIAPLPAIAIDTRTTADSANLTSEGDQDKTSAATGTSNDPAGALIAMLQLPQEIRTPVINDATRSTTAVATDTSGDPAGALIAMLQPPQEIRTPVIKDATRSTTAIAHLMTASKAVSRQPAANIDPIQAQIKSDRATVGNQVIHSTSGPEISNSTALTGNQPGTPPPTQDAAPSIAASHAMPNMPVNNRLPGTRQTIAAPLGSNGWADEFSQKINWMSTQQNQVAELHLNPPDLGPLDVVLKISDNQATALFTSPHGAVRDAVENALPKLRETLADNGITLGNATVSDQPPRDRDAERFMSQGSGTTARPDDSSASSGSGRLLMAAAPINSARRHNGMVDIFA